MFERGRNAIEQLLGLGVDASALGLGHMAARTFVVFCFAVALIRVADRRLFGHAAGFDIVVAIILGSVLSRGINGQAAFFPTLGASALLVGLHHLLATLTFHSHWFSSIVKGRPHALVRNGKVHREHLRQNKITDEDLDEQLRLNANLAGIGDVEEARLERNGSVSVVKSKQPRGGGAS